jgi:Ca2+-transporting ATPase
MNALGKQGVRVPGEAAGSSPSAGVSAAPPRVTVIHRAVAGRVRLRVAGLKHAPALARAIEAAIAAAEGVVSVRSSPLTGTVLVLFRPPMALAGLAGLIEALFPNDARAPESRTAPAVTPGAPAGHSEAPAWHMLSPDAVAAATATSVQHGLSSAAAQERGKPGSNRLPRPPQQSSLALLARQFTGLPVALLAASAAISLATGGALDAVVIAGVVVANAAIGYATEREAVRTIEALNEPVRARVKVLRDGTATEIALDDVVFGDVQVLEPGSFVAADARVVRADGLSVDESALTGESMPVAKTTDAIERRDTPLALRANMIYRGTALTGGSGRAIVVATAGATEIGRIQEMIGTTAPPATPMEIELSKLGRQLAGLCLGVSGLMLAIGLARGLGFLPILKTAISLAVAAVPEGLPTVATTTLALGIRDMRRRNVLVRRFDAVEALGAVQFVCFDKTGTLTRNTMSALAACCGGRSLRVHAGQLRCGEMAVDPAGDRDLRHLLTIAVLCNEAEITPGADGSLRNGSPTETALLAFARDCGLDPAAERLRHPLLATTHRTETQALMRTSHRRDGGLDVFEAVKGSPAAVLRLCTGSLHDGRRAPLSAAERKAIEDDNERLAGQGLRVLGFASGDHDETSGSAGDGLVWAGLIGLADPIRSGMPALMQRFHRAGIATVMITGDQSATAYAVARDLGLSRDDRIEILDALRLEDLDPEVLSALAQRVQVFSRVSPRHKLQIVQALQRAGKVVAMTGDGINDGPALRAADIGIAMGRAGTDVARDVADVILADDDPRSIAEAICRGRVIFANIRKALRFLLATNLSEIVVAFAGVASGADSPLSPMQLLWINLLSDVFPALALAVEPADEDVMALPPHAGGEAIVRRRELGRIGLEALAISAGPLAACAVGHARGLTAAQIRTMTFESLVSAQLLHAVSCRSERSGVFTGVRPPPNPALRLALAASFAVQGAACLVPSLRRLLGLAPLTGRELLLTAAAGLVPFTFNEAAKTWLPAAGGGYQRAAGRP